MAFCICFVFRYSVFFIDDAFELVKEGYKSKDSNKQILLKRIMERFQDKIDLINTG